jgi:hypothetical protein
MSCHIFTEFFTVYIDFKQDEAQKQNLRALEEYMTEFFLPSTTNDRKRSIGM